KLSRQAECFPLAPPLSPSELGERERTRCALAKARSVSDRQVPSKSGIKHRQQPLPPAKHNLDWHPAIRASWSLRPPRHCGTMPSPAIVPQANPMKWIMQSDSMDWD